MYHQVKTIVIADDDDDDLELFQITASEICFGVKLIIVKDGLGLMRLLEAIPVPDIIVLDLNMPYKSGKDCLIEIRSKQKFDGVKVVILSTSDHSDDVTFCLSKGANDYFVKPSSIDDLKRIISAICNDAPLAILNH